MTVLTHKGYVGIVEADAEAGLFHGEVANTRAVLTFSGRSFDELHSAFAETITDYEAWCAERGVTPEKPYSGKFMFRSTPELHRRIAAAAAREGKSINAYVASVLDRAS